MTEHDSVERLIKLAGERDLPSAEGMQRARAASEQAWRQTLAQPKWKASRLGRFLAPGLAMAASLVLLVWFVGRPAPEPAPPVMLGRVMAVEGSVLEVREGSRTPLSLDAPVSTGAGLETSQGRVAIAFGTALSLRLDHATRLTFDGPDQITLSAGSVYVDSGGISASSALRILTPAGEISHIGTQFQVSVVGEVTRVRVREGRVQMESSDGGARQDLATGDALEVRGGEFFLTRGLPSFGADWAWAAGVGPVLEIENRPLAEFLAWLVREQGWRLHFASESLQEQAGQIRLHGSLAGLDAEAMLERVSLVTGVRLEVRHGVLWVGA
jgi:ferric-dicitrate binding protein FerR (iron transport regulator)